MNIVLKDNSREFSDVFKRAVEAEYRNMHPLKKAELISEKGGKSILVKITAPSPAKLKGISSTLNRLWDMSKKIYYEI
ncbi:MAG: hypothetical protein DRN66_02415 [Candidatus Nanohalarchaeota archaeon]|nr:MAG: hypothetical protein DRN66_02415 [Candidatus Nanohaloarchaeota archaeon]